MMNRAIEIPPEDLPYWMRQARRGWDWGALLILGFSLIAALPFLVQAGLPQASENFVYMAEDYSDTLREGRLYPRWSPHVLGGYGAPIPNFYPPAAPYSAALIKVLFTNDTMLAVRIVFVAAFLLAGISTYAFVRRHSSALAGLLAALLFLYSPYFGKTLPYVRGDLALFVALAALPFFLWALDRLLSSDRASDMLLTALALALLILAHPSVALASAGLGLGLGGFHRLSKPALPWRSLLISAAAGIGLTSFYWLPALYEREFVHWLQGVPPPRLQLANLLVPLQAADLGALIPPSQFTLGLALPLIAFVAAITLVVDTSSRRFALLFLIAGFIVLMLGIFVVPEQHWLLGLASFCLASTAGTAIRFRPRASWSRLYRPLLFGVALVSALNTLLIQPFSSLTIGMEPVNQLDYEQRRFGIAILPADAALPSPFPVLPSTNRLLLSAYETQNINKIAPLQTASRSRINLISHESHRDRFQVTTDTANTLNILTAYYPGWSASAGGQRYELREDPQTGLGLLEIPAMTMELVLEFGSTPLRTAAWILSWLSLGGLLLLVWRRSQESAVDPLDSNLLRVQELRLAAFALAVFAAAVFLFTTPGAPFSIYPPPGHGLSSAQSFRHRSEVGLETLAYKLNSQQFRPGDTIQLSLYWQTVAPLSSTYQVQLRLTDQSGAASYFNAPLRSPGHYPTSRWRSFLYVTDTYLLPIPQGIPPGDYQIALEVFDCNPECNERLTFFDASGRNMGQTSFLDSLIHVQS